MGSFKKHMCRIAFFSINLWHVKFSDFISFNPPGETAIPQILCMEVGTILVGSDVCAIECMGVDCAPHALVSGEEEIAIDLEPSSDIEID